MTKKVLSFALLALMVITANLNTVAGQAGTTSGGSFDWVKSYFGPDYEDGAAANEIFGSAIDSEGNIYILGQFIGNARWDDDTSILPFSAHRNRSAVVAKFSPDGQLVWHKEFYSSYTDFVVYTMRMVGDTALMLFAEFRFPFNWGSSWHDKNEVYYMDTLLTTPDRFPESPDSLKSPALYYAFITIGLESGNLIEEHFWIPSFVKNDGSLLRDEYSGYLITNVGERVSFNVDSEGNIILARQTNDYYGVICDTCPDGLQVWSPREGNISTMRLLVDGATKQLDVPLEPSSKWNWQIIKLSPHMDSVIASTYLFDSTWRYSYNDNISMHLNSIDVDANDNIYMLIDRTQDPLDRWPVKNSDTLAMEWYSCMIRYDSELTPTGIVQVTATYTPEGNCAGYVRLLGTYYDSVTNSLFINGESGKVPDYYTTLNYRGSTLDLKNNACWLRLDADDLSLVSYGKARSTGTEPWERTFLYSDKYGWSHNGSFAVGGNRVFCQVKYQCNILFQNTQINNPYGMGLFVWDYDGHELEYIDYNSPGKTNEQGYIFLKDSSLWLTGTLTANAAFGNHNVNAAWNSHAYIARYTDTAFLTPYVYDSTGHGGGIGITLVEGGNALVAYPNPFRQQVTIQVESGELKVERGAATAWLTDMSGRSEEVRLTPDGPNRYSLDLTSRPQATYLLTLTTADGKQHTVRLLKQTDVFGN